VLKRLQRLPLNNMLSTKDKQRIEESIRRAEAQTSGEIRVHLDRVGSADPMQKATKIFERLGMTRTIERNGVLIYVCFAKKQLAILGDQGIHERVPEGYWNEVYELISKHFKQGLFAVGLIEAVTLIGAKLCAFFPPKVDDTNELSNDITEE